MCFLKLDGYKGKNSMKKEDLGVPPILETSICK